jgi:hypothetical protein
LQSHILGELLCSDNIGGKNSIYVSSQELKDGLIKDRVGGWPLIGQPTSHTTVRTVRYTAVPEFTRWFSCYCLLPSALMALFSNIHLSDSALRLIFRVPHYPFDVSPLRFTALIPEFRYPSLTSISSGSALHAFVD